MEKSKTKKMTLIIIAAILLVALLAVSVWLTVVDVTSRRYNLIVPDVSSVPSPKTSAPEEFDVELSQLTMHYAVYGDGYPLVLIHGNGGSHKNLEDAAKYLANDFKVYAIDSRCHGESGVTDAISYDLMADDVAEFIEKLGLSKPYVVGHSDGGITAIALAINHPDSLGGFVAFGANSDPKAFKAYFTIAVKISYSSSKSIVDEMMLIEPHFTAEQLGSIKVPSFIVAGEFDIVKLSDTAFLAESIPNSRVAIVKWGGHSYVHDGRKAYALVKSFVDSI